MKEFKIAVVGAGGLGVSTAWHLSENWPSCPNKSPKLCITIFDADTIELSNLNRQILFNENDIGSLKSKTLSNALSEKSICINSNVVFDFSSKEININNITEELSHFSLIIDATDSPKTKFLLNDFSVQNKITYSYAGVIGTQGQSLLVIPGEENSSCLRCLFGDLSEKELSQVNESCQTAGILGAVAGKISLLQSNDILEYALGEASKFKLKRFDFNTFETRELTSKKDSCCPYYKEHSKLPRIDLRSKQCPQTFILSKLGVEQYPKGLIVLFSSIEDLSKTSDSLNKEKIATRLLRGNQDNWQLLAYQKAFNV